VIAGADPDSVQMPAAACAEAGAWTSLPCLEGAGGEPAWLVVGFEAEEAVARGPLGLAASGVAGRGPLAALVEWVSGVAGVLG
jgi:hypothetical protein